MKRCIPKPRAKTVIPKITNITFLVTNKCNLWCRMCDYRAYRMHYNDLSLETIKRLITEAYYCGLRRLELSGGEPMVRDDIYEIICYAASLGIIVRMFTNGTLIGRGEVERLLAVGLKEVTVSMEGFAEVNDRLRGTGSYKKALQAISAFQARKTEMSLIQIAVTVSKYNFRQIFDFTKYITEELGIRRISYHPFNREMLHRKKHVDLDDFIISGKLLAELDHEFGRIAEYTGNKDYMKKLSAFFSGRNGNDAGCCEKLVSSCGIDAGGVVYPCGIKNGYIGNATRISFAQIITSRKYRNVCSQYNKKVCAGCF